VKLSGKTTVCAAAGVVLATVAAIITVYSISHANRVNELRSLMSALIQQAETVTENVDALHQSGAFNLDALRKGAREAQDFRKTTFYRSIPVVAGWSSLRGGGQARLRISDAGASGNCAPESSQRFS